MIKNFIVSALKNLYRNKATSFISVIGLATGIACFLMISMYIKYSFSADSFHINKDMIFRVYMEGDSINTNLDGRGKQVKLTIFETEYANLLLDTIKENAHDSVTISTFGGSLQGGSKTIHLNPGVEFVSSDFFKMFSFSLETGSSDELKKNDNSAFISRQVAKELFGSNYLTNKKYPLNKKIIFRNKHYGTPLELIIAGILNDPPGISHLENQVIVNKNILVNDLSKRWDYNSSKIKVSLYIHPADHNTVRLIMDKIKSVPLTYYRILLETYSIANCRFLIEPITGIYLNSNKLIILGLFIAMDILILIISCINIFNLNVARAITRIPEAGIRKAVGAKSIEIRIQFIIESFLFCIIAGVLALAFLEFIYPRFLSYLKIHFDYRWIFNVDFLVFLLLTITGLGLLSGFYPAWFLSSLKPLNTYKLQNIKFSKMLRNNLVLLQLVVSIFLFICFSEISSKFSNLTNKYLGFDKEDIIVFNSQRYFATRDLYRQIKLSIRSQMGVLSVTASNSGLWNDDFIYQFVVISNKTSAFQSVACLYVDKDYFKTYNIKISKGNDFTQLSEDQLNSNIVIINEAAEKLLKLDWTSNGSQISMSGKYDQIFRNQYKITGVCSDFQFNNPRGQVEPLIILPGESNPDQVFNYLSIKIDKNINKQDTINRILGVLPLRIIKPELHYVYLAEALDNKLSLGTLNIDEVMLFCTIIATAIAAIGIFSMVHFEIKKRHREISIRKSIGAAPFRIFIDILKDFIRLAVIANCIALPVCIPLLNFIFRGINYPYPYSIQPATMAAAALFSVILVFTVAGSQALKAALAKPIDNLRYE